jgi:hypothetical protein
MYVVVLWDGDFRVMCVGDLGMSIVCCLGGVVGLVGILGVVKC